MTEDEALANLNQAGLLDVLSWAAPVAFAATDQMFDEELDLQVKLCYILHTKGRLRYVFGSF